ncbi:MAG: beta-ketoacyl-ACP synthase II [Candidatus Marinimicrobia bacterium]|jgi:3-oxoacyl-[acyl-carrier-protein] synthase II|nr:beta-ketoacyl-ACP synthase II [Candidatus Neomarinimicrobiota bacterium]MBT3618618.1 beta-ketoacyl-ACP synthase II [Candidatus Neomarinimicrobiota bacterium]MBT3829650.1 beta-ketoacyl-ACP synthase II [Candidatus Neomarinimicrobiota bacterium]MBT3997367.1 beta-ketoacyl-ACP synthase II [Candidatus Neomarinimicrobiota bacterium]MBT4281056.1 beta-ketoacyl-ACP synthase II [Candidatus Neomarinimicrobiota bacterium]
MSRKRVVITGMGVLAPNGNSVSEFWSALCIGKSGIGPISYFDATEFPVKIAGELSGFRSENHFDRKELRKLDPFSVYALVSTREAINQAELNPDTIDCTRVGVILGTGIGGVNTFEEQKINIHTRGNRRVSPFFVPKMIANIAAGHIAIEYGFKGPNKTVISACASATDALGTALRTIQYGDADVVISGGTEASITDLTIAGFGNMKALSTRNDEPEKASRPFEIDRDGFVLGEGAGILILESEEHAKSRGATILAELSGYGATDDAFHITQPAVGGTGAMEAMRLAIQDSGMEISDVDYINAHGTSTPFNDKNESAAIASLFGEHTQHLKISSTKSMTGHLLGGAGGIEAVASVMAIQNQTIPPTINYVNPDPECTLDYTPNEACKKDVNAVLSNTFGFGGHNAVIMVKGWTG